MIFTYDTDEVAHHEVLAVGSLRDLGCATAGCTETPTHLLVVKLTFRDGHVYTLVSPHCSLCTLALNAPEAKA